MGYYEVTSMGTPVPVVLDECIELARNFGNADSSSFVNGLLDKLVPNGGKPSEAETPEATAKPSA